LATGAALAIWARSEYFERTTARRLAAAALCALAVMSLVGARFGLFGTKTVVAVALRYTQAYLSFGALFVLVLVYRGTKWTAFLRNRFMQLSGALSYCLYLIHLSLGDGYRYLISHQHVVRFSPTTAVLVRCASILSVSFGIALLSRKYLEEPILALKDRFTSRVSTGSNNTAIAASPVAEAPGQAVVS
jgi:peptidoglycan/LPS O-acetylase OafA/YrhL